MFGLSFAELVVIVIIAVVVIGPKELPRMLRKAGEWAGKMRRMAADMRAQSGIDDVLREGTLREDIAEIRRLARGELDGVRAAATLGIEPADSPHVPLNAVPGAAGRGGGAHSFQDDPYYVDADEADLRAREYPREGADSYGALPDTAVVYDDVVVPSELATDALYTSGEPGAASAPPGAADVKESS